MKICSKCKTQKLAEAFPKNKRNKDGLHSYCKVCINQVNSLQTKNNPRKKEYNKRWFKEHRQLATGYVKKLYYKDLEKGRYLKRKNEANRKAKIKNNISIEEINELITKSENICFWCGCDIPQGEMHLDHVYPLSKGGGHTISNLVVSCRNCNLHKQAKDPEVWLEEILEKV